MKVFIFDFDATITTQDTTDLILELPQEDRIWQIEEKWKNGNITSYQCMKAQAQFLKGITIDDVHQHLTQHSQVDPGFSKLVRFLKTANVYPVVLSEGYDISLSFHDVYKHIDEVYCSKLKTVNGKFTGELQILNERRWDYNKQCIGCCICKVDFIMQLRKQGKVTQSIAVGDGASDGCLFPYVDVSFSLNPKYDATHQVNNLSEVYTILQETVGR
jgi:HAD superfamily phosphoserine phosphatase-like hydrolase